MCTAPYLLYGIDHSCLHLQCQWWWHPSLSWDISLKRWAAWWGQQVEQQHLHTPRAQAL
jgi:hypothetical protein